MSDNANVTENKSDLFEARLSELLSQQAATAYLDRARTEALLTRIQKELRPASPVLPPAVFVTAFLAIFFVCVIVSSSWLGTSGWQVRTVSQRTAMFTVLGGSAVVLGTSLSRQMFPGSLVWITPRAVQLGLLCLIFFVVVSLFSLQPESNFFLSFLKCYSLGLFVAISPALLCFFVLRRGAVLSVNTAGATTGLLAGLVALTVLEIHCPILDQRHILLAHLAVPLSTTILGMLFRSSRRELAAKS